MLVNPNDPWAAAQTSDTQSAAHAGGQHLIVLNASTEHDIDTTFEMLVQQRAAALLVTASPLFVTRAEHLIGLSAHHALPTIYFRRELAAAGGLMSYGVNTTEAYGQMGVAGATTSGETLRRRSRMGSAAVTHYSAVVTALTSV